MVKGSGTLAVQSLDFRASIQQFASACLNPLRRFVLRYGIFGFVLLSLNLH